MSNEQKLRDAFEARMTDNGKWPRAVEQGRNGCYLLAQTENAWVEWQACAEALATTEPAVNQQLTTEPFDEREAFEKWLGIKPCGAAHDFGWSAWQARAALAARKPLSDMDRAVLRMPMDMALGNDIGRLQYYQRVQGLLDRLDGIGLEVKT